MPGPGVASLIGEESHGRGRGARQHSGKREMKRSNPKSGIRGVLKGVSSKNKSDSEAREAQIKP